MPGHTLKPGASRGSSPCPRSSSSAEGSPVCRPPCCSLATAITSRFSNATPPATAPGGRLVDVGAARRQPVPAAALFMARFRELLDTELSDVARALEDAGALRCNRIAELPERITGGFRRDDRRFEQLTGRRPMVEATIARAADAEPGVEVRRGIGVRGLVVERTASGRPHVGGVVTDRGTLHADLVVDAGGRRSMFGEWLTAAGAPAPVEERADSGYVYYGRHFRSADGAMPPMLGPPLQHYESLIAPDPASRQRPLVRRHHGERQGHRAAARPRRRASGNASSAATRSSPTGSRPSR